MASRLFFYSDFLVCAWSSQLFVAFVGTLLPKSRRLLRCCLLYGFPLCLKFIGLILSYMDLRIDPRHLPITAGDEPASEYSSGLQSTETGVILLFLWPPLHRDDGPTSCALFANTCP